jgi:hypothetical protein
MTIQHTSVAEHKDWKKHGPCWHYQLSVPNSEPCHVFWGLTEKALAVGRKEVRILTLPMWPGGTWEEALATGHQVCYTGPQLLIAASNFSIPWLVVASLQSLHVFQKTLVSQYPAAPARAQSSPRSATPQPIDTCMARMALTGLQVWLKW